MRGPRIGRFSSPALAPLPQYAREKMARRTVGPRRSDSPRTYLRPIRIIGGLSVLALAGVVVWDLTNDEFWFRHTLFTALVASVIVVAMTAAVLNEVLERRQRERWSVLAQYALLISSGPLASCGAVCSSPPVSFRRASSTTERSRPAPRFRSLDGSAGGHLASMAALHAQRPNVPARLRRSG